MLVGYQIVSMPEAANLVPWDAYEYHAKIVVRDLLGKMFGSIERLF